MKPTLRYLLFFAGALVGSVYLHEIGHAVAGWVIGVAVVPTPAKEYVLQSEIGWNSEIWIALGGPVGTAVAALAAAAYFWRKPSPKSEAVVFGTFLPLGLYSFRFFLAGRGHDGIEWQAAQTALGLTTAGHALDIFFLCFLVAGLILWFFQTRPSVRSVLRLAGLAVAGLFLLIVLQVSNNALFDRVFPSVKVTNVPPGIAPP